ncbi:MAG: hypothetical protein LBI44_06930 [Oscillospiraceae bacterium]|jgi:hypothetical protein|nr:hypothetical protein [Oscillospiraceae bacterium]
MEMFRSLGFRYIFWDTGYSLFFAAVTIAVVFALFAIAPNVYHYSASVAVAPLMFLLIAVFAETSERFCGLYKLRQTCRYTIRHVTALRVICYSIVGAAFTAVVAVINARDAYVFLLLFTLWLSALFVCGAFSLTVLRFLQNSWLNAVLSAARVFVNASPTFSLNSK